MKWLIFLPLLLTACSGREETLRFNLMSEAVQLDWNRAIDTTSVILLDNVMEGLTTYSDESDKSLRPSPALATSWTITDGGRTFLFHLRGGVRWSDGVELTAQHFVDSWERLLSPATRTTNAYHLFDVEGAQAYSEGKTTFSKVGVRAADPLTLEVRLRRPVPYFLHLVSSVNTYPIRKDLIEKFGAHWTEPEHFVTLGPYRLAEWVHGSRMVLEHNPTYWGPIPEIRRVVCRLVSEPLTALALYENGELDVLPRDLPPSFAKSLQTHKDFRMGAKLSVSYVAFNTRRPPFDKAAHRRAFIQAMNRAQFAAFFRGSQTPTKSWIPPGLVGYRSDVGIAAEGREGALPKATVALRYSGNDTWNLVFQAAQRLMEEKLGLQAKLERLEWQEFTKFLGELSATKKWSSAPNLIHLGWVADYPDAHSFMNVFTSSSESNYAGWSNKHYDELVEKAVATQDEGLRAQYYQEAQKILLEEEAVVMPLFFTSHQALVRSRFKGLGLNALDKWYFKNVRVEEEGWSGRSLLRRLRRAGRDQT